jgi:hypothetical protein
MTAKRGNQPLSKEHQRLPEPYDGMVPPWRKWGPYVCERFLRFGDAVGREFSLPTAVSENHPVTPHEIAGEAANRMISIFKRGADGKRPSFGFYNNFQEEPHWNQCLLFNEYYHGDTGMGLGASHQTGWSGLVANLIDEWRR